MVKLKYIVALILLPLGAMAEIRQLPLDADYCAILRAFTANPDPRCPEPGDLGPTRGLDADLTAVPPGDPVVENGYFIRFAFASDVLSDDYRRHLDRLGQVLGSTAAAGLCLKIVGHTDAIGGTAHNMALSVGRARSVMLYLVGSMGIPRERILTEGRGESQLLDGLSGNDARNRRVEILAKQGAGTCST